MASAVNWQGTWSSLTVYAAYDAVYYLGSSYISLVANNQGNIPNASPVQWALLAQGGATGSLSFTGPWSSAVSYQPTQVVYYSGASYACIQTTPVGVNPTNTAYWVLVIAAGPAGPQGPQGIQGVGFAWKGAWSAAASYLVNDVVGLLGSSYVAITANSGVNPTTDGGTNWQLMAAGTAYVLDPAQTVSRVAANAVPAGSQYYDLTLHLPLWTDGTTWRDAAGGAH